MKFLCVNCDESFEHEGEGRARCPKCMRVHGIQEATVAPAVKPKGGAAKWIGLVAAVALLGVAATFAVRDLKPAKPGVVDVEPLSESTIEKQMTALGVTLGDLSTWLEVDDTVEAFAKRATAGKSTPAEQTKAIVDALQARAKKRAFVAWSMIDPRDTPLMNAPQTLKAIEKDNAALQLYPIEVATLATLALRSLDVPAMVAEIHGYEGDRAPTDPSGRLGYFGVALVDGQGKASLVVDPFGGRAAQPKPADYSVLNDLQALGAALNVRALYRALRQLRPMEAMTDAKAAIKLAPRSPAVRGGYAAVALSNGGVDEGESELRAAAQLRNDSPRRNNLSVLLLAKGDADGASKEIAQALTQHSEFASGHATLASIHLASGDRDQAFNELKQAEQLDRDLPNLALLWAHYYATQGDLDKALEKAEQGVTRRPNDAQAHLMLGRIYRESGRLDQMRREAQRVLELVPSTQRGDMEQMIRQLLGPTALDKPADEIIAGDDEAPNVPSGALDLSAGSKLLGGAEAAPSGSPSLMPEGAEGSAAAQDGPLLMLGDPSKLRLSGPGTKLKLQ